MKIVYSIDKTIADAEGQLQLETVSRYWVQPDLKKLCVLTNMPPCDNKKQFRSFSGILNYLDRLLPSSAEVGEPSRKLMSAKAEWT